MTAVRTASLEDIRGDYRYQAEFVIDATWRLMAMQDSNVQSPSHGCFHYAYWRDKTSEFPDARFQEAGATLALLSLPYFNQAREGGGLAAADELYGAFAAGLRNLARQQYREGSYDEWYKGERGFAATEFTTIAYGLAARFLGDRMQAKDRRLLEEVLARAGRWLSRRDDRVKANHEAAASAALALAWEVTGEAAFKSAARAKLDDTLRRQNAEGWFPEIGGMDLGYCSVLLDYVMIYSLVTGDGAGLPSMTRLLSFMLPLLHPDGTISPEMGLCLNPYVSRLGIGLLSEHDTAAQVLVRLFRGTTPGRDGLTPYLADDLRLARWSHLPLATALLSDRFRAAPGGVATLREAVPAGWVWRRAAAVGSWRGGDLSVYFSPAGGGAVRIYQEKRLVCEDLGLELDAPEGRFSTGGYDPGRPIKETARGFAVSCRLGKASFFSPGFLSRLVLRVGATTSLGSRFLRALIDYVRLKRRTAANQSAAPIAESSSPYQLERLVEVDGTVVRIVDQLDSIAGPIDPARVDFTLKITGETVPKPPSAPASRRLVFVRTYDISGAAPLFAWRNEGALSDGAHH